MGIGAAVKLAGNLIFTPIPSLGVTGAALSTLICYIVICGASVSALKKYAYLDVRAFSGAVIKISMGGILCAAGAFFMQNAISDGSDSFIRTVISCGFGAIIYIIITYFSGVITKSTLKALIS